MSNDLPKFIVSDEEKYRQQYAHFRGMNDLLYKLPVMFSAILGGFWYFAFEQYKNDPRIANFVFLMAAVFAYFFNKIMYRFKLAFKAYLNNLNKMDGDLKVTIAEDKSPSTIKLIRHMLLISAAASLIMPVVWIVEFGFEWWPKIISVAKCYS